MRNVSTAFKQLLAKDKRKYNITLEITLTDNTVLTVTNENIMDGGIDIDDAVSQDSKFTALGSTVIGSCTVVLYDITEKYSDYDFSNAKVVVKANLDGAIASDEITFGEYTVDDPTYNESSVTLSLLDNMCQFDREYDSYNIYNEATTIQDVVFDACTKCGVLYDSSMSTFPNYNFVVPNAPKDNCTYREVIGWCATIAGCFARITSDGKLKFSWFNTSAFNTDDATNVDGGTFDSATPYATGDSLNGGTFNPWSDPSTKDGGSFTDRSGIHHITTLRTQNLGVDDVVITGIQVSYDVESENSTEQETATVGTDDYTISIENNPFITKNNYSAVLNFLQPIIIGLRFRPCNITHPNDPTIEAGDVGYVWDTKGVQHRILITRVTFNPSSLQNVICGAESPGKNSSSRLTEVTKAIVKSQRLLNEEKTIRQQLEEDFQEQIANSSGLYWTKIEAVDGSVTIYAHDKTDLAESSTVLKINSGAIATTGNYTGDDTTTQWYGFEFDGVWLANIISTIGIDFDWGVGGKLTITDNQGNETFFADADTGVVRIKASQFSLTDGSTLPSIKTEAINSAVSSSNGYTDTKIADYQGTVNAVVQNLQSQIDGQIMSWYYDHEPTMQNEPASNWTTTALREQHEGDVFYWKTTGYAYRFMQSNSTWGWTLIQDTDITTAIAKAEDAQETADHKRRVFVTQPYPPYDIGDLWTEGSNGDLYRCETARSAGSFTASDWALATKYTDDSALNTFLTGTYASTIQSMQGQIDEKIETFYQSSDPSSNWNTSELRSEHVGDLWFCSATTGTYAQKIWQWDGATWQEMKATPPTEVIDIISGKAQIFVATPTVPYYVGDLWVQGSNGDILKCSVERTTGSFTETDWTVASKYTDDSTFTTFRDGTFASFVTNTNNGISNAQNTANSRITTFYQASTPTANVTGDLWIDTDDGNKLYRYDGSVWIAVQDTAIQTAISAAGTAQATADKKIVTFAQTSAPTSTSTNPLDIGDLWIDTDDNNKMYRWNGTTWVAYSDSSSLQTWINGEFATTISSVRGQIDGKIETFYQSSDPSSSWTTTALQTEHKGDIWYCTNTTGTYAQKTWQWSGTAWQEMKTTPPASIMDSIDGKAQIFISRPTPPYHTGDLWFNSTTSDIMTCITTRTSGSYSANDWQKRNKYTDDSAVTTLDTSLTQQEIFNRLTNNGQAQGIYLQNGKLYLNFAYAVGQLLKLGGANNSNGTLEVYNSSNVRIGKWDKDGAEITGVLKMISSNTYATVGSSSVYNVETVSGFKSRTLENFQYVIPYGSNGNIKALKTFVKANNGELQEIFAAAGNTAKRVVVLTTGSYLPEISTSSDLDNVGGFIEEVSYSSSTGLQYRLYDGAGWRINDGTTFKINNTDILITTGGKSITPSKLNDATHNLSWNNEYYSSTHFTYGILHFDGNKIAFDSSSSRRYKHNINYNLTEDRIPNNLLRLPVAEFIFNDDHPLQYSDMQGKTIPGIIAEDVAEIYPSATIYDSEGNVESWDERRIIPGMLALIQEQDKKIKSQEAEIEDLKSRLEKLERAIMNI